MTKLMRLTPLLLAFLLAWGCGKSDGGNVFSDTCEDYCEAIGVCLETQPGQKLCVEDCLEVYDRVVETGDTQVCTDKNTDAFVCATELACDILKEYLVEKVTRTIFVRMQVGNFIHHLDCIDTILDCCEPELVDVINECPNSFQYFGE